MCNFSVISTSRVQDDSTEVSDNSRTVDGVGVGPRYEGEGWEGREFLESPNLFSLYLRRDSKRRFETGPVAALDADGGFRMTPATVVRGLICAAKGSSLVNVL